MKEVISAVQAALVMTAGCAGAGWLLLGWLNARVQRGERAALAAVTGTPVFSLLLVGLLAAGQLRRGTVTLLAAALVLLAWWRRNRVLTLPAASGPWIWRALGTLAFLVYGIVTFLNGIAPDTTPPGANPALEQAARLAAHLPWQQGGPPSAAFPLWAAAFSIGRHSGVSLTHTAFFWLLSLTVFGAVRRWMGSVAAALALVLIAANPGLGAVATHSGTEVLLLALAAGAVACSLLAWRDQQPAFWAPAALCAAFALALFRDPQAVWFRGFLFHLIPGPWLLVPVLAVVYAWVFHKNHASAALVILFAGLTGWPRIAWMLAPGPMGPVVPIPSTRAAFRKISSEEWLAKRLPGYIEARFLEKETPPGSYILAEAQVAPAWITRRVALRPEWYALASAAFQPDAMPTREEVIALPLEPRREFSITRGNGIFEVRFFRQGVEVPRLDTWRVLCPFAFDNNPVTRCSGQAAVRFGAPVEFDEVKLLGRTGQAVAPPRALREWVRRAWKQQGVTHIFTARESELQDEFQRNLPYWRLQDLGESHGARLYRVE